MKPRLFITRKPGIIPPPKTSVKVTIPSRKFLPIRFFFDRGYAIVRVKNIAVNEPDTVTNKEIRNALGNVGDEKIYS